MASKKNDNLSAEKMLRSHVLDDVEYTKAQHRWAITGLIIGLWGIFFAMLVVMVVGTKIVHPKQWDDTPSHDWESFSITGNTPDEAPATDE